MTLHNPAQFATAAQALRLREAAIELRTVHDLKDAHAVVLCWRLAGYSDEEWQAFGEDAFAVEFDRRKRSAK